MNANRLIGMLIRQFGRRGISKGIDMVAGSGKSAEEMTPEERQRARALKNSTRQAQRGLRMARRFSRF